MPAAMLTTRFAFGFRPEKRAASCICCGLTANTTTSPARMLPRDFGDALDAVLVEQAPARGAVHLDRAQLAGGEAALQHAADQRIGHIAAADETCTFMATFMRPA